MTTRTIKIIREIIGLLFWFLAIIGIVDITTQAITCCEISPITKILEFLVN